LRAVNASKCVFAAGHRPGPRWGSLQCSPDPLALFGGKEWDRKWREGEGKEGRERREKEGEGEEGKGRGGEVNPRIKILATALVEADVKREIRLLFCD